MQIGTIISSLITSAGPGGIVVLSVIALAATVYYNLTRWILKGGEEKSDFDRFN
ncbi:MAG: hypothetical protein OEZ02_07440 [Anaerolineae bacterium]|nr:hypothetical protein [Anaerolineae bacterium]